MAWVGLTTAGLIRAGAETADEIGFERTTPTELAQRFGVRTASLYWHVKNAHDLKTGIALFALEELADRASEAVAGRAGKDALTAFANVYRDYAGEHPGRFAATQFPSTRRRRPPGCRGAPLPDVAVDRAHGGVRAVPVAEGRTQAAVLGRVAVLVEHLELGVGQRVPVPHDIGELLLAGHVTRPG
ncbi:hypothetical protein STENM36S_01865 [Streptomyces tendae]